MKIFIATLSLISLTVVGNFAQADFRTQDNVDYIIRVTPEVKASPEAFNACVEAVEAISAEQGTGSVSVIPRFGVIAANLTTFGADTVGELECVASIRLEQEFSSRPRTGRSN